MSYKDKPTSRVNDNRMLRIQAGLIVGICLTLIAFHIPFEQKEEKEHIDEPAEFAIMPNTFRKQIVEVQEITPPQEKKEPPVTLENLKLTDLQIEQKLTDEDLFNEDDLDKLVPEFGAIDTAITMPVDPDPVSWAEVMPKFPGGEAALMGYLAKIPYCNYARNMDIEGTVYVRFIIDKNGKVTSPELARSVFDCLDEAVVEYVERMPDWTPGQQGGHNVPVIVGLPVTFKLQ